MEQLQLETGIKLDWEESAELQKGKQELSGKPAEH